MEVAECPSLPPTSLFQLLHRVLLLPFVWGVVDLKVQTLPIPQSLQRYLYPQLLGPEFDAHNQNQKYISIDGVDLKLKTRMVGE